MLYCYSMCFACTWNGRKWITSGKNQSDQRHQAFWNIFGVDYPLSPSDRCSLLFVKKKPLVLFFNTVEPKWSSLMSTLNSRLISFVPFDDRFLNCLIMYWNEAEVNCTVPQLIPDRKWTPKWTVNDPQNGPKMNPKMDRKWSPNPGSALPIQKMN